MTRLSNLVDRVVSTLFRKLGRQIASTPGYFIIVPILVACIFGTGLQRIRYEDDPEYLFTPTNGRSKNERSVVETLFPMNSSRNFDLGRITRPGHFGRVIAVPLDDGDALRGSVFDEIRELDMVVQNLTIEFEERLYRYQDICARKFDGSCFRNDVLDFRDLVRRRELMMMNFYRQKRDSEEGHGSNTVDTRDDAKGERTPLDDDGTITFPLMHTPTKMYFLGGALGGVTVSPADNKTITNCSAINLMYYLDWSTPRAEAMARIWEAQFLETIDSLNDHFDTVSLSMFVSNTLTKELQRNTQSVVPFLSLTLVVMLVFAVVTCMMSDWVTSKPWLGVIGCISSITGVGAAFGLVMYFDLEFIGINLAAPFLMLGIGMDDSFVLLAAWRRTDPNLSVVDRLGATYAEAAVSVTITSLTNFLSFWIGAITPFPSVRIFCVYTATAVLFTYIYQLTLFGGCLAVAGHCEGKGMHSLFCLPALPASLAVNRSWCFRLFCTGGRNPDDPTNPLDNPTHCLMRFFRDGMGPFLSLPKVKASVLLCFALYLAVGVWGCLQVREGLERHKLSRSDSYSVTFYEREDRYFRKYAYRVQIVVNQEMDYSDPDVQEKIESMMQRFESSRYISGPGLTESWLRAYKRFQSDPRTGFLLQNFNASVPSDFLKVLDVFFNYPTLTQFKQDVRYSDDKSSILATRYVVQAKDITDANKEKDMVLELRKIADEQPFNVTVFQQYFIYFDQFILVRDTSIQSICVAVVVMILVSLVFIPSLHCAVFVAFSIVSIEVGVIGYMTLWGVNLDSISMINLIMCIGFSVDYSAHISYAYFSADKESPDDGIRAALHSLGVPIFQGSVSTILGVVALVFAPSYIFLTFFKTVFLVILFGALHGILLLPVLLSLSDSCFSKKLCKGCKRFKCNCGLQLPKGPEKKPPLPPSTILPMPVEPYAGPRLLPAVDPRGLLLRVGDLEEDKSSKADLWDKDLGLGTSGESSDGSWKCPREDSGKRQDDPPPPPPAARLYDPRPPGSFDPRSPGAFDPRPPGSSDRSRCSTGERKRYEDNPAFCPEEDDITPQRGSSSQPPRDRMRSYIQDMVLSREAGYFLGPPRRPATTGWAPHPRDRPRRSRERPPRREGEPDRVFTVRL